MDTEKIKSVSLGNIQLSKQKGVNGETFWVFLPHGQGYGVQFGKYPYNMKFKTVDEGIQEWDRYQKTAKFKIENVVMENENLNFSRRYLVVDVKDDSVDVKGIYDLDEVDDSGGMLGPPGGDAVVYVPIPTKESLQIRWKVLNERK